MTNDNDFYLEVLQEAGWEDDDCLNVFPVVEDAGALSSRFYFMTGDETRVGYHSIVKHVNDEFCECILCGSHQNWLAGLRSVYFALAFVEGLSAEHPVRLWMAKDSFIFHSFLSRHGKFQCEFWQKVNSELDRLLAKLDVFVQPYEERMEVKGEA